MFLDHLDLQRINYEIILAVFSKLKYNIDIKSLILGLFPSQK